MIYHIDMTPEQHAWLVAELELMTLNLTENDPPAEEIEALAHGIEYTPCFRLATDAERNAANRFDSSEVNIDTDAVIAAGPNGSGWVSAWIWIPEDDDAITE